MAWIECVPNISEGRRKKVIDAIADAIRGVPAVDLRSIHSDPDHNRSVYTIVGSAPSVHEAAYRCVAAAREHIDITKHEGVHPRIGAADVVPLVPLAGTKLSQCGRWARELASRIESELDIPAYLFGAASESSKSLPEVRKSAEKKHPTAGAVAVGARELMIAFNVMLQTEDLSVAEEIAKQIREADGGLPAVRALGFPLASRNCVQVSMNLLDYRKTSPLRAYRRVRQLAREANVEVSGSEVVGMIPREALSRGYRAAIRSGPLEVLDSEPGFLDRVAARTPVPAGGSAAAHTGALGAALVVMSCDCSRPTPRLRELRLKAERLRERLTALVEADVAAYRAVTEDGGEEALKAATEIPVQTCEACSELWAVAALAAHHCDDKVSTDCAGGRRLAEAARDIAAETARANLPLITDGMFRSQIARRLAAAFSG
ncbi:MAG: cyclodeaminase/cyclohydrolase family protein [Planctomycetota bacterium]|jgi:glutamate formiminotransferase/formiminotetrahydrofolate cyclodeaminase